MTASKNVQPQPNDPKPTKSVSEVIWDEIKGLRIDMFGLPNQFVHMHCQPATVEPSRLFLTANVGAVLPALEAVIYPKYTVEKIDKYMVVSLTK